MPCIGDRLAKWRSVDGLRHQRDDFSRQPRTQTATPKREPNGGARGDEHSITSIDVGLGDCGGNPNPGKCNKTLVTFTEPGRAVKA